MTNVPYGSVVGCLMYAMVLTRPDIAHVVSVMSRYMAQPGRNLWNAVKWILRYLHSTMNCGLTYGKAKEEDDGLRGYVESDYTGDLDRRRSLTGYKFMLNSYTVNWKTTLQSVVAFSTIEAEYIAATKTVKKALWLKGLVIELGLS